MAAADHELAQELGLNAGLVAAVRRDHLVLGEHWTQEEPAGRVEYTPAGRDRVWAILGLEKKEGAAEALPAPLPDPVRLKVVRLLPNPLWVAVALPGGTVAEVAVRRRTGLRLGVLLLCLGHPDGRWECVHQGHASPLSKKEGGAV